MSYILTPNGRKPMVIESSELDEAKQFVKRIIIKEEAEQVDEVLDKAKDKISYAQKAAKQIDDVNPYGSDKKGDETLRKRHRGIMMLKRKVEKGGMGRMDEDQQIDELKGIKAPGEREKYVNKAKASVGGKIMKAGLKKMVGLGGPSDRDMDTIQKRVTGIARAGDRRTAADLAGMTGSSMPRSSKKKMKEDVEVELDMDHFVEYVIENFPELTEMYIRENYIEEATGKTLKDYPHLHKHVVEKQKKDKLPASHTRDVGNVAVHARNQAAHSRADSALASGDAIAKRRAADVYRDHYGYEGSSERITSQRTKKD